MPQNERIKEEIGWLKVAFGLLVAADASVLAWVVENFDSERRVLVVLALLLVAALTSGVFWINTVVYKRLAELEKL